MGKWLAALLLLLLLGLAAMPAGAARFVDIGAPMNLPTAHAGAWGDYDSDGYADLFIGGWWEAHRATLWHNNHDGSFTDVTVEMGLRTEASAWDDWGAAWGDFNNDGRLDLIVVGGNHLPYLYRNDGDHFTDVGGTAAGFSDQWYNGRAAAWGDYDGDNWLDLYVTNDNSGAPSYLYRNNRDETFTEVTSQAGMDLVPATHAYGCSWVDANGDGLLDLTVGRWEAAAQPRVYANQGNGAFVDLSAAMGIAGISSYGVAWGDYDRDGLLDLVLGAPVLYHNNGDGTLTNVYSTAMGGAPGGTLSIAWGDYDNDGWLDLSFATGLYHNDQHGGFDQVAAAEGMATGGWRSAVFWADLNRDGRLDLLETATTGFSNLYYNTGAAGDGNWVRVRALTDRDGDATDEDTTDDRDALGAHVWVNLDNDPAFPPGRTLQRLIDGGSGYGGQNEPIAHFGLGDATTVAVRVVFPDYSVITQTGVVADQQIEVRDTYQETGDLEGTITAAEGGAAIYNAAVTCGHLTTRSSVTGAYRFPFVPSGVCEVAVTAEGYEAQTIPGVVIVGGETTTLNVALAPPYGTIAGHVTDAVTSAAIAGATVSAGDGTTTTEADGSYLLTDLTPGDYTVSATAAGYHEASHSGVVVVSEETTTVDLALTPLSVGAVNGVVQDAATTSPVAGAVVTCGSVRALTDSSGAYSFPAIAAGSYILGAAAAGYWWSAAVTVEVEAGQTVTQDFVLTEMSGAGPHFEEITGGSMPGSIGGAWGDYDADGYPDLFLTGNVSDPHGVRLYHNEQGLTLHDVSALVGLPGGASTNDGAAWGDYDNDGTLDVMVTGDGGVPDKLFHNVGGSFTDVAASAGLTWDQPGRTIAWCDYDADGWLDVFICYINYPPGPAVSRLYHNSGDGTFSDATDWAGMTGSSAPTYANGCAWGDYDNDGRPDLMVCRYTQPPMLFHNTGDGTFTDVSQQAGVAADVSTNSAAWLDYDNDGWLDCYLVAYGARRDLLFRNNHDGTFTDVAASAGMAGDAQDGTPICAFDYDGDGFTDIYVGGALHSPAILLYHNGGDGTFTNVAAASGITGSARYVGAATADVDGDGAVDLLQCGQPSTQLFHNIGAAGNWLRVRALTDRDGDATDEQWQDDRDAIGARVELNVDDDPSFPPGRTLVRVISGGSGFLSQDELIAHFGVPVASPVAVRVIFPDGSVVVHRRVAPNQQTVIKDVPAGRVSSFWDVPLDYWALAAVEACVEAGIVQGYWDNSYRPTLPVTRDQMAVYMSRAIAGSDEGVRVPTGVVEPSFTDVDEDYWAYRYVEYCVGQNVVQGYWDGSYRPTVEVNRGQMAIYIARGMVAPSGDAAVPAPSAGHQTFTDVSAENEWSWCYQHVEYLAGEDIVQGYWDNTYHPERVVTRDQMAVYVARAFELPL